MQVENSSLFLPWYNAPLIEYLHNYLKPEMNIFEYGCGFSSLFYAQKGCTVYGVETKREWSQKINILAKEHKLQDRMNIRICTEIQNFYKSILSYDVIFDVIIIDSIQRLACLEVAKSVYKKGIIILDNTERPNLQNAKNIMNGFKFLEFEGERPSDVKVSKSLVFLK